MQTEQIKKLVQTAKNQVQIRKSAIRDSETIAYVDGQLSILNWIENIIQIENGGGNNEQETG